MSEKSRICTTGHHPAVKKNATLTHTATRPRLGTVLGERSRSQRPRGVWLFVGIVQNRQTHRVGEQPGGCQAGAGQGEPAGGGGASGASRVSWWRRRLTLVDVPQIPDLYTFK